MKNILCIIAILCLPAMVFSQHTDRFNTPGMTAPAGRIVDIFPNPGNGAFTVYFSKYADTYVAMTAYDHTGRQVYVKEHITGNPVLIDMSQLQAGIYFLVFITADNRRLTEKVAIVK